MKITCSLPSRAVSDKKWQRARSLTRAACIAFANRIGHEYAWTLTEAKKIHRHNLCMVIDFNR